VRLLAALFCALTFASGLVAVVKDSPSPMPPEAESPSRNSGYDDLAWAVGAKSWAAQNHVLHETVKKRERFIRALAQRKKARIVSAHGGLPGILLAIRRCESGGRYDARNPVSSASGAYQFISSTWARWGDLRWPEAWLAPPEVQDAAALRLYQASGTIPWNASKGCWS
jgi:hypothetical protein